MVLLPIGVLAAIAALQTPDVPPTAAGSWNLEVPQTLRDMSRKIGLPDPYVKIKVQTDGTFVYKTTLGATALQTTGRCTMKDGKLALVSDDAFPCLGVKELVAAMKGDALEINGGLYRKFCATDLAGTWTLRSNNREDRSIKVSFTKEGKFEFKMSDAKSGGKYVLEGTSILLTYETVDGQKVDGMSRTIIVDEESECIIVDNRFKYKRQGTA